MALTSQQIGKILIHAAAARDSLARIEALLSSDDRRGGDELDPKSPLNKQGANLTPRGVEVCYRLFDGGKTRYAVADAMGISYGAATHRFHAWEKLGGQKRERQPLK